MVTYVIKFRLKIECHVSWNKINFLKHQLLKMEGVIYLLPERPSTQE